MHAPLAVRRHVVLALLIVALGPNLKPLSAQVEGHPLIRDGRTVAREEWRDRSAWIEETVFVEASFDSDEDGVKDRLHVNITRPKGAAEAGLKLPVIYETSPYFAGTGSPERRYFWNPRHELGAEPPAREEMPEIPHKADQDRLSRSLTRAWIPHGYIIVHSASPGTGRSRGCPTLGGPNEALAPKAVIDWLNGRAKAYTTIDGKEAVIASWTNGKVAMIGTSYNGTLPVAAATTGVEGLKTIVPVAPNTSYYHYYRSNGLVRHPGGWMGEDIDVLFDFIHSGPPDRRAHCVKSVRDDLLKGNLDRVTGDWNDFWASRDYALQMKDWKCPALLAHAFNDWNVMPEHTARILAELKRKEIPVISYWHQGGHGGDPPLDLLNAWFARWLYDVDNGVESGPKAFIVREKDRPQSPTPYPDWPHPEASMVALHPMSPGLEIGLLTPEPTEEPSEETFTDDVNLKGSDLANAARADHRLLYASPPLKAPLHISGTAQIKIRLAADRKATNLSVWLVSLPWTERGRITDNIITRGWADPQNHRSLSESEPLEPGRMVTLNFSLQPDDQVIPEGAQIGLMIFASDQEFTLWPEPGTRVTIDLRGTVLELPIVGGRAAYDSATGKD